MVYETLRMTYRIVIDLSTNAGYFEDTFKNTNIAMYTETHQCMASKLPGVQGYRWESVCHLQPQMPRITRGSRGVVVLYKRSSMI